MLITQETIGVVYWNTWYRAEPSIQLAHVEQLDETLRIRKAAHVMLYLFEATKTPQEDGLVDLLERKGYTTAFRATDTFKNGTEEGICIASRDMELHDGQQTTFYSPRRQRAARNPRNFKQRWIGRHIEPVWQPGEEGDEPVFYPLTISGAHFAYPAPSKNEREAVGQGFTGKKIFGGDLNTLTSKGIIHALRENGWIKLRDPSAKHTMTFGRRGVEVDHAFVSCQLAGRAVLEIGDRGPSNHHPLLVTVDV